MRISRQILALSAASLFGATAQLQAQQIDFHGGVIGCFVTSVPASPCPTTGTAADFSQTTNGGVGSTGTLKYTGGTFTGTTTGDPDPDLNSTSFDGSCDLVLRFCGDFGALVEGAGFRAAKSDNIFLELTFFFDNTLGAECPGCNLPGTPHVTGTPFASSISLFGVVNTNSTSLQVNFDPKGIVFNFTNGGMTSTCFGLTPVCGGGPFNGSAGLVVDNVSGTTTNLRGTINVLSTTPEPATVALFATGLVGLIPVARRRAKNRA